MRIHVTSAPPALSSSSMKPLHTLNTDGLQPTKLQSSVTISDIGNAKSKFLDRFQPPNNGSGNRAELLVFFSEKYGEIRKELVSQGGEGQKQSLALLSDVYDELTAGTADQLADQFDMVFDGSDSLLTSYGMTAGKDTFDKEAFRNHLANLAKAAKQIAVEHPGEVAARLASSEPSEQLETMNYRDIVSMVDALQNLSKIKQPPPDPDPIKFGKQLVEWHTSSTQVLAQAGLSDNIRQAVESSFEKMAKAKMKTSTFKQVIDQYNSKIEETRKQIARFSALIAAMKGKFAALKGLAPDDPRIQSLLSREQDLIKNRADYTSDLKDQKDKLSSLELDPDSVTDTEEYHKVKTSYQTGMDTKRS